jgi:hypothetical protein
VTTWLLDGEETPPHEERMAARHTPAAIRISIQPF